MYLKYKNNLLFLGQMHQCLYCGKELASKYNLKVHIRDIHEQVGGVQCQHCHKIYKNQEALRKHVHAIHTMKSS